MPILRAEDHCLQIRLRNNQPIERIVMMTRQPSGMLGMAPGDRQNLKTKRPHGGYDRLVEAKLCRSPA